MTAFLIAQPGKTGFKPAAPLHFWNIETGVQLGASLHEHSGIHGAKADGLYRTQALDPRLTSTTFSMVRVPPLLDSISRAYKRLFFGPGLAHDSLGTIQLCRLYFGRTFPPVTESLAKGLRSDLPLDIPRYLRISAATTRHELTWPSVEEVSRGMGSMLAVLHWGVGIDASDIELVLGGRPSGLSGLRPYVFDYNQCTRWTERHPVKLKLWTYFSDIASANIVSPAADGAHLGVGNYLGNSLERVGQRLATKLHYAEYYYPRPSANAGAYVAFRLGYLDRITVLLDQYATPDPTRRDLVEVADLMRRRITGAATAFLDEFERLDQHQAARKQHKSVA